MNINNYPSNFNNVNFKGLFSHPKKKENPVSTVPKVEKPIYKKASPYILAGLMLAGVKTCSNMDNVNYQSEDMYGNMKIECVNVKPEVKDSIVAPVLELKSKLNKENDFLDDLEIDIVDKYNSLDDSHSFKTFLKNEENTENDKGCSLYSDNNLRKVIVIQKDAHGFADKLHNYVEIGVNSEIPSIKQTLLHEVGHQFDQYFGHNPNSEIALKWDSIMLAKDKDPKTNPFIFNMSNDDFEINKAYRNSSGLSDKEEFKAAIQKDFQHITKLKKMDEYLLSSDYEYYTQGIDLSKPITMEDVQSADYARGEVYANLFGYAMGGQDGDKKVFLENFQHSLKVVQSDINKYIGQ